MPHCWFLWEEFGPHWEKLDPIIGVVGRDCAPSLISLGEIMPHCWNQWMKKCPKG